MRKKQYFRHTFKCLGCKKLTVKISVDGNPAIFLRHSNCAHCCGPIPVDCVIDTDVCFPPSIDTELLCVSIIFGCLSIRSSEKESKVVAANAVMCFRALIEELKEPVK